MAYCLVFYSHPHPGMVRLDLGHRQITAELGKCCTPGLVQMCCCYDQGQLLWAAVGRRDLWGFSGDHEQPQECSWGRGTPWLLKLPSPVHCPAPFLKVIKAITTQVCGTAVVNTFKIRITSKSTLLHDMQIPITFHRVLEKALQLPCQCYLKCACCPKKKKKYTEAVVNSAAHCNSASKYHGCRLWMFSPYHQELILGPISSFLAPEESIDYSQVIVLAALYESKIPHLPLTWLCLKQSVRVCSEPSCNGASYSTALSFHLVLIATMLVL